MNSASPSRGKGPVQRCTRSSKPASKQPGPFKEAADTTADGIDGSAERPALLLQQAVTNGDVAHAMGLCSKSSVPVSTCLLHSCITSTPRDQKAACLGGQMVCSWILLLCCTSADQQECSICHDICSPSSDAFQPPCFLCRAAAAKWRST
jgi:hypothetical protein